MSSPSKRRGTQWETDVTTFLRESGYDAQRVAAMGKDDEADIHFTATTDRIAYGFAAECKNEKTITLSTYVDESNIEAHRARRNPIVIVKRRMKSVRKAYVIMELDAFIDLFPPLQESLHPPVE